jgi:hypothetical protein
MSAWRVRAEEEGRFRFDAFVTCDAFGCFDFECDALGCDHGGWNFATAGC